MRLILGGILGRMGQEMLRLSESGVFEVASGVDAAAKGTEAYPVVSSYAKVQATADCIVDFSRPSALNELLELATEQGIPCVLCTTGYTPEDLSKIEAASRLIPILRSANMSLGVNLLLSLCEEAARLLEGFDIEITEAHHRMKADAPSGTAIMLKNAVMEGLGETRNVCYGREGRLCPRGDEIGIHSLRGGTVIGEHTVAFYGTGEEVLLTHRAESRAVFANGACKAAAWLAGKPAGLYSMQDLIREKLLESKIEA